MQAFRTLIKPLDYDFKLMYTDDIASFGSCFAEHISDRLLNVKFPVLPNPFGILYNPISIADTLQRILSGTHYDATNLTELDGRWFHFDFHGAFSDESRELALEKMNASLEQAHTALPSLRLVIVTLGSAFVWWHRFQERVVANCHKLPGHFFERRLLSVSEVSNALQNAFTAVRQKNPAVRFLCTVSPVRHVRDGLVDNQLSKATLRLALDQLSKEMQDVYYFPAYEIMMDDLRDYRFYQADMIHPTEVAIDYIWDFFRKEIFTKETLQVMDEVAKVKKSLAHRPLSPGSEKHKAFQQSLLQSMEVLEQKYPFLSFLSEKENLNHNLDISK